MATQSAVCPVYIGRDQETARLGEDARQHRLTLVAGPAGIGKSRLAGEAWRIAEDLGFVRLVGHCIPEATVPYVPFVTALRRHTRTSDEASLRRMFEGQGQLAAGLLPEVASIIGLSGEAPQQEDLFAAVWHVLRRVAGDDGCLLLLEDVHWADSDSLALLSYLAHEGSELPLWMTATFRSDELHRRHPLTPVVAELRRQRLCDEIELAPLGREDLRSMVSAIFDGTDVGDEFVDALLERTEGTPFFVEELIKVLVDRGDIYRESGDWARRDLADIEMPASVRETLLARTHSLDPSTVEALALAALAGDRLDMRVLVEALGTDQAAVDEVIRTGLQLQLLVERRDGAGVSYSFRHALTREALGDELVGPDRQRAHRRIAESISTLSADDLDPVAAQLAEHYLAAGEPARAADYGVRAARFAAATYALDEAGRWYERTIRLLPRDSGERLAPAGGSGRGGRRGTRRPAGDLVGHRSAAAGERTVGSGGRRARLEHLAAQGVGAGELTPGTGNDAPGLRTGARA